MDLLEKLGIPFLSSSFLVTHLGKCEQQQPSHTGEVYLVFLYHSLQENVLDIEAAVRATVVLDALLLNPSLQPSTAPVFSIPLFATGH